MPGHSARTIDASTRCCAIFGHPIHHSASPAMHNAAFAALGINARYLAFDVHPDQLAEAVGGARRMQFMGLNLTVPHKLLALPVMDQLAPSAAKWGAVNTVCFEGHRGDGDWRPLLALGDAPAVEVRACGHNTDAEGLLASLTEDLGMDLGGKRVVLLGAGGAGRAAALLMAEAGVAELFLVNRTQAKAEAVAAEIAGSCPATRVEVGYPEAPVDLVINATSLGLRPDDPLPIDLDRFPLGGAGAVYDMIYRPSETGLMQQAAGCGVRAVNGLGMLLYQGTRAFEIWTGQPAPVDVMRRALQEEIYGS